MPMAYAKRLIARPSWSGNLPSTQEPAALLALINNRMIFLFMAEREGTMRA